MELKKLCDIETLIKNGVTLYLVFPVVGSTGKIMRNKIYETVRAVKYSWYFDVVTKPANQFCLFFKRYNGPTTIINEDDEISTKARIFTTKDEAKKVLSEEVAALSYKAIKLVDYQLKKISNSRATLDKREEKLRQLKEQYYEASVKRFSK